MGKNGKCSHVGGWRKDLDKYKTCTEIRCQFNIPGDSKKEARAVPITDWDIVKPKTLHNEIQDGRKRR
eukprot:Pgem_evm1s4115